MGIVAHACILLIYVRYTIYIRLSFSIIIRLNTYRVNKALYAVSTITLHLVCNMPVYIQSKSNRCMTQTFRNRLIVISILQANSYVRMAKITEPEIRQTNLILNACQRASIPMCSPISFVNTRLSGFS